MAQKAGAEWVPTLFARYGHWGVDLTHTHDAAALNNSAPLVMHRLDREIRLAKRIWRRIVLMCVHAVLS